MFWLSTANRFILANESNQYVLIVRFQLALPIVDMIQQPYLTKHFHHTFADSFADSAFREDKRTASHKAARREPVTLSGSTICHEVDSVLELLSTESSISHLVR